MQQLRLCKTACPQINLIRTGVMTMGRNVGSVDKTVRYLAGIALLAVSFLALGGVSTTAGIVAAAVGVILFVTGLINFCPLFKIFGISSFRIYLAGLQYAGAEISRATPVNEIFGLRAAGLLAPCWLKKLSRHRHCIEIASCIRNHFRKPK